MTGAPRFHSTEVSPGKTAAEIGELVGNYGVSQVGVTWDAKAKPRRPVAVHFIMEVPDVGEVPVEMKPKVEGILKRLRAGPKSWKDKATPEEQAHRVAWRQLKYHIEMTLEMVANEMRPFHEAFMPDVMIHRGAGEYVRLGDLYTEARGQLALPAGKVVDADYEEV